MRTKKHIQPLPTVKPLELPDLIDGPTLQRKFGIGRTTMFKLISEGLPTIYLSGRLLRFDPGAVAQWLQEKANQSA